MTWQPNEDVVDEYVRRAMDGLRIYATEREELRERLKHYFVSAMQYGYREGEQSDD